MKELSIEEKAKAYDELFVKAKQIYNKENDVLILHTIEDLFPEFKKSEDEKIRKWLIGYFNQYIIDGMPQVFGNGLNVEDVIAWLEKQGEKIDAIENFDTEFEKQVSYLIASAINKEHEYNQGYVKWVANALFNYAKHELEKQGKQNITWSEEDESNFQNIDSVLFYDKGLPEDTCMRLRNWLKSLRPQSTWKPTELQMDVLLDEVNAWTKGCSKQKVLESLYNDLKKLKG